MVCKYFSQSIACFFTVLIVCFLFHCVDCRCFFKNIFVFIICFWLHWAFVAPYRLSLVAVSRGYSLAVAHSLLIVLASLVAGHRL